MTEYIILRKDPGADPDVWHELPDIVEASSTKRALSISNSLKTLPNGDYVAVPMRSWQPLPVKNEQTTKVTIG